MSLDMEHVRGICSRVAAYYGLVVADVEYVRGAGKGGRILRIFLDTPWKPGDPVDSPPAEVEGTDVATQGGVTIEHCAKVSREVSTILDVENVMLGDDYVLEVSSPGLDRKLVSAVDFQRFAGSRVKLMTRRPVGVTEISKGNRHFEGKLESFDLLRNMLTLDLSETAQRLKRRMERRGASGPKVEIEFANVEKANLVPEI